MNTRFGFDLKSNDKLLWLQGVKSSKNYILRE